MKDIPTFTIVIPVFNEKETIPRLYERLTSTMNGLNETYEILFVDAGRRHSTDEIVDSLTRNDQSVKFKLIARSFGHRTAISAGMHYAGLKEFKQKSK